MQGFVFDKAYHQVPRDSVLVHPESALLVHPRVNFFKVYSFVNCFPTVLLNRIKLKQGTMKLKTYEYPILMREPGAIYPHRVNGYFLVHPESAH